MTSSVLALCPSCPSSSSSGSDSNPVLDNACLISSNVMTVGIKSINKVEKKGRTVKELHEVIEWLTGYDNKKLQKLIKDKATFDTFFKNAKLNKNARLITGVICGYRVEEIEDPFIQKVRYLDKLVDELAQGRAMEKILRT